MKQYDRVAREIIAGPWPKVQGWQHGTVQAVSDTRDAYLVKWDDGELRWMLPEQIQGLR